MRGGEIWKEGKGGWLVAGAMRAMQQFFLALFLLSLFPGQF
jgi:hypothetical protein